MIHSPVVLPLQVDGGAVRLKHEVPTTDGMTYAFSLVTQGACMLVPSTYNGELFAAAPTPLLVRLAEATEPCRAGQEGSRRQGGEALAHRDGGGHGLLYRRARL